MLAPTLTVAVLGGWVTMFIAYIRGFLGIDTLYYYLGLTVLLVLGSVVHYTAPTEAFAAKIGSRNALRSVAFVGQSHQIVHVLVLCAVWVGYASLMTELGRDL